MHLSPVEPDATMSTRPISHNLARTDASQGRDGPGRSDPRSCPRSIASGWNRSVSASLESTRRRQRILALVQEALSQLRLDMKYLLFDLEATRRERNRYKEITGGGRRRSVVVRNGDGWSRILGIRRLPRDVRRTDCRAAGPPGV